MKEQTRNTEVQINEEETCKLPKRIHYNNSKDDHKPWKQNGVKVWINSQRLRIIKE